jgi:beta-lactamase class A
MANKRALIWALLIIVAFSGGILAGRSYYGDYCLSDKFQFINKDLGCGGSFVVEKRAYGEFKGKLEDFIEQKKEGNIVSEVAVYFRDLKNGPTLGINEHTEFAPASLLKVPIMITYLSLAEDKPELLEKTLKYHRLKEGDLLYQNIKPKDSIKENISYSIRELIRYMIQYSDNNAYFTLVQYLNQQYPDGAPFFDTMSGLGLTQPDDFSENNLTVKSYASIFVQLYYSSFFNKKETSEEAFKFLAESDFADGLVAGVPADILVAHKFGERETEDKQLKQMHDCGIVYYPKNPYLLCVMTRGEDVDNLTHIISAISRMVYEEFDSRKL